MILLGLSPEEWKKMKKEDPLEFLANHPHSHYCKKLLCEKCPKIRR